VLKRDLFATPARGQNGEIVKLDQTKVQRKNKVNGLEKANRGKEARIGTKKQPGSEIKTTNKNPNMALDAMFNLIFLAHVYSERPILPSGIRKVVTRFSLQPNGFFVFRAYKSDHI
jgi:hypothetical protein